MSILIGKYFSFSIIGFDLFLCLAQILYGTFCLIYMSMTNKELTLGQQNITIPPLVQLLCGIVILSTIMMGCCGLSKEITCCVNVYSSILLAVAIVQIAVGTFAAITFTRSNDELQNQIKHDMNITFKRYNENPTLINNIQSLIHCCGKDSPSDMNWNTSVSRSCCSDDDPNCNLNSTTLYRSGCVNEVIDFVIRNNIVVGYSSICSGIVQLAGLGFVIIGILVKLNVGQATSVLPTDFSLAPILSIIIGAVVFITAFLGCCGAVKESTCMLTTYAIVLLTIFILQVAIGIYAFLQIRDKPTFNQAIEKNVQKTFDGMYKSQEANETMQVTQRFLHCCGVNGFQDYQDIAKPIPLSCCQNQHVQCPSLNNDPYSIGCAKQLQHTLEKYSQIIGGVAIGIAAAEIIGAIFGLCLASSIRNSYRRHMYA